MAGQVSRSSQPDTAVAAALVGLGFSQYEARTYAGLIGRGPMTGYAIAKQTGVPQPKVYETLGRLVERGAITRVSDSPANFIAVSPARVIAELESSFRERLSTVEVEIARMPPAAEQPVLRTLQEATNWTAIAAAARELIAGASERVYVSGHAAHLEALSDAVAEADRRRVRVDVLTFGEIPFVVEHGAVLRHSSTDGTVYRHHQARHLALTCDSNSALWALAPEGTAWEAVWARDDSLLTALVKGFIRHDLFGQRMFRDFGSELRAHYGAGLEGLFESHSDAQPTPATGNLRRRRPA
jgi:HTH-type transcriptional regulator, sugar sensing transcriptional regulator